MVFRKYVQLLLSRQVIDDSALCTHTPNDRHCEAQQCITLQVICAVDRQVHVL